MAGKQEPGPKWRQTSVLLRSDIFEEAQKAGLNISDECNRALAERAGIDYRQQKIPEGRFTEPVMIAPEDIPPEMKMAEKTPGIPPAPKIINAEAPGAAKAVKELQNDRKRPVTKTPSSLPGRVSSPATTPVIMPVPTGDHIMPTGPGKPASKKATSKKADAVKDFFGSRVERIDTEGAIISKDEMYDAFAHWCRDHRISPVPDKRAFSVALKNKFAVQEKIVEGSPAWLGIWLKERKY
jgi:hypothetical protein